ncbi:MAG: aminotransferase class V-fold PLP-dependent enzyme [Bacteroidales bacterium]
MTSQVNNDPFTRLANSIYRVLETYSNVHRGSGHKSVITTKLFEDARKVVLDYLGLNSDRYSVIFSTPRYGKLLGESLKQEQYEKISTHELGIPIGVTALAIQKRYLPRIPFLHTGGGTTRLMATDWVLWANGHEKFEPGTPAVVNIIAFATALMISKIQGSHVFKDNYRDFSNACGNVFTDQLEKYQGDKLLKKLKETLIGANIHVPTMTGTKQYINLDNSASTPAFGPVWDAYKKTLSLPVNAREEIVHHVRKICADFMNAPASDYDIFFTGNTTEAINLVKENLEIYTTGNQETVIVNSLMEHSSNDLPWRMLQNSSLLYLNVDEEGFFDPEELETLLSAYNKEKKHGEKFIKLVAISGASNVLGTCNDIAGISKLTREYGARLLVDAAQLAPHRTMDVKALGIDYLALSGHKLYAPFGCGLLVARKKYLNFDHEELATIRSSGEENVAV